PIANNNATTQGVSISVPKQATTAKPISDILAIVMSERITLSNSLVFIEKHKTPNQVIETSPSKPCS
ncbi:MAG: hypothetical protein ACK55I_24725, partial [bacterium]